MKKGFYYVTQKNSDTNSTELLGFNLTEKEKDKLFYSLGKNGNSSNGDKVEGDENLQNAYGGHLKQFKNAEEAFNELIIKPDAFNSALELIRNSGFDVVKKGVVSKNQKVISYQMENTKIFG